MCHQANKWCSPSSLSPALHYLSLPFSFYFHPLLSFLLLFHVLLLSSTFLLSSTSPHPPPPLNFIENLKGNKHAKFPQSRPRSSSSSPSPAASAAASNGVPSSLPLCPLPVLSPSLTSSSHPPVKLSTAPLKFRCVCPPRHATPVTPTLRVAPFHTLWLLVIRVLSGLYLSID